MCGIVYTKSLDNKPVNKQVIKQYKNQRNRGNQGFGYFMPQLNVLFHHPKENRAMKRLKTKFATEILFHHRFPTSTDNVINACHPFDTGNTYKNRYIVVHNGVIFNDDKLYEKHFKQGITYTSMQPDGSYNDSEALAHDIAQYIEGKVKKLTAEGSIAFIAIQMTHDGKRKAMYFGRNSGSPLKMLFDSNTFELSSEGNGVNIDTDTLYCMDYKTGKVNSAKLKIPEYTYSYGTGYMNYGYNYNYYGTSSTTYGNIDDDDDNLVYDPLSDEADDYGYKYSFGYELPTPPHKDKTDSILDDYINDLYINDLKDEAPLRDKYSQKLCVALQTTAYDDYDDVDYAVDVCGTKLAYLMDVNKALEKNAKSSDGNTCQALEYYDNLDKIKLLSKTYSLLEDEQEFQYYNYQYTNQKGKK